MSHAGDTLSAADQARLRDGGWGLHYSFAATR